MWTHECDDHAGTAVVGTCRRGTVPGMTDFHVLFASAAAAAADYRNGLDTRPVASPKGAVDLAEGFGGPLPDYSSSPHLVLERLIHAAGPGLTATAGPRFFGFVIGGALPAASATEMLAVGWDQNGFNAVLSPAAAAVETAAGTWLKELMGIPLTATVGFVTGAQAANTVGLAAARQHVLAEAGWDVGLRGLVGGPPVRVLASAERHGTIDRSLRLLGLGTTAIQEVRTLESGAIDPGELNRLLREGSGPTIVCLQVGNVNTGACDDLRATCEMTHARGGWAHVDGAFGLWAAANPATRHLLEGVELADSWGCDGHKWLNLPYDSGFAFVSRPSLHAAALSYTASYLTGSEEISYGPGNLVLESSRRARGFTAWAGLVELGRQGIAELVERCCRLARRFAAGLAEGGLSIVNDVVLNQVLVDFGTDAAHTDRIIGAIQADGTCWMGGTTWRGRRLMRISVSNYSTTDADIDASVAAVLRLARVA